MFTRADIDLVMDRMRGFTPQPTRPSHSSKACNYANNPSPKHRPSE